MPGHSACEYKLVELRKIQFQPFDLEAKLNEFTKDGWELATSTVSVKGNDETFYLILKKKRDK